MGYFSRQFDRMLGREIDRAVDRKIDAYLESRIGKKRTRRIKRLAKKGRPLDADTEKMLRRFMSEEELDTYRTIHNEVAEWERLDNELGQIDRLL